MFYEKKIVWVFAPTPLPDTPDPQLQSFLAWPKTDAPIFFLYYPLAPHIEFEIFSITFGLFDPNPPKWYIILNFMPNLHKNKV